MGQDYRSPHATSNQYPVAKFDNWQTLIAADGESCHQLQLKNLKFIPAKLATNLPCKEIKKFVHQEAASDDRDMFMSHRIIE